MIHTGISKACMYCEKQFQSSNVRRIFCSDVCKTRYSRENRSCFYCGDIAGTRDHLFPHSSSSKRNQAREWKVDWVNSCQECNSYLGKEVAYSFYDRIMYLHDKFKKKKKLHKGFVEWDEDELEEVSEELKQYIWNKQQQRWKDERRLSHIRLRALQVAQFKEDENGL